LYTASLMMVL
jgi:hypothetical protein